MQVSEYSPAREVAVAVDVTRVPAVVLLALLVFLTICFFATLVFYVGSIPSRSRGLLPALTLCVLLVIGEVAGRADRASSVRGILVMGLWNLTLFGFGRLPRDLPAPGSRRLAGYPGYERIKRRGRLMFLVLVADFVLAMVVGGMLVRGPST